MFNFISKRRLFQKIKNLEKKVEDQDDRILSLKEALQYLKSAFDCLKESKTDDFEKIEVGDHFRKEQHEYVLCYFMLNGYFYLGLFNIRTGELYKNFVELKSVDHINNKNNWNQVGLNEMDFKIENNGS